MLDHYDFSNAINNPFSSVLNENRMEERFEFEDLGEDLKICISQEHRFGTDAFLLADFSNVRHKDVCADLCSGCGIIAMLLYKYYRPKGIYAVEIQKEAHEILKISVDKSQIGEIMPVHDDLKQWKCKEELDVITCNPPYKKCGTGEKSSGHAAAVARHEIMCGINDICACGGKNLKFGGRLCLCNRPERLCDIITAMRENGIEPKRLRTVHKNPGCPPWLILVEGRKGGKPFLQIEKPLYVRSEDGGISQEMKRIYSRR